MTPGDYRRPTLHLETSTVLSRDFGLTETQRDVKAMAAEFVDTEIVPHAREWDRAERVDPAIVPTLGALGFLGLTLPEEYGGVEADMLSYVLVTEELGRGDSSVRGIVSVSLGLVRQDDRRPRHPGTAGGVAAAAGRR